MKMIEVVPVAFIDKLQSEYVLPPKLYAAINKLLQDVWARAQEHGYAVGQNECEEEWETFTSD